MGDCDPEREVVPVGLAECYAAQLNPDILCIDHTPAADTAGITLCARGLLKSQARQGRALRSCGLGSGRQDGELYALR